MAKPLTPDERKDFEKALRQSRASLWGNVRFAIASVIVLWALHRFLGLPAWLGYLLGCFAVFGALSDAINIPYVKARLRQAPEREGGS